MRVLVIGSGGREHALCWKLKQSPECKALFCAPGNPGIAAVATCVNVRESDHEGVIDLCRKEKIDFVVIGPEGPLVTGLVDSLQRMNIKAFGPSQVAAQIEGSKAFMKDLCARAGVPTAKYKTFTDYKAALDYVREQGAPIVIKTDGLAAGKGVTVAQTVAEAEKAVSEAMQGKKFGSAGQKLVIEECLVGEEVSFFALCDGGKAVAFASAQDHKAVYDGDKGPNTGGMGAYSPAPVLTSALTEQVMREIISPVVNALRDGGSPYHGILFAGLMLTAQGPRLIEFNVRFGDPETQAILPRLKSDLLQVLYATATSKLETVKLEWHDMAALCVVMAAQGYPGEFKKNTIIQGLDDAAATPDALVFHAGTAKNDNGRIVANGGRVLGVTGTGADIKIAQQNAYAAVDRIDWPQGFCRRDIGWRAVG